MPVEYFFPTPIYYDLLKDDDLLVSQTEIFNYLKHLNEHKLLNPWGDTVSTTFKYGEYDQILLSTPKFNDIIKTHCKNFLQAYNITNNFYIKESWINISKKLDFQHFHIHDDFDLSGVYYYQTCGDDGDLVLKNPSLVNRFHVLTSKIDSSIFYKPEVGKLILFPGFLEHAVYHNTTDNERISVTFNVRIER